MEQALFYPEKSRMEKVVLSIETNTKMFVRVLIISSGKLGSKYMLFVSLNIFRSFH